MLGPREVRVEGSEAGARGERAEIRLDDAATLEQLVQRHLPTLRSYVRLRCGAGVRAHESTSDLVQSVCRELLLAAGRVEYRGEAPFRHWLCTAAEHKIRDRVKRLHRQKRDVDREVRVEEGSSAVPAECLGAYASLCSPSQAAIAHETAERLEAAFDRLDEPYSTAVLRVRLEGQPYALVAEELGVGEAYARVLVSRGLAKLATLMDSGD
jgi:RNA polymerase sigma-70 factor (ECF subfamily)